jgi:hypothetical protein
VSFCSKLGALSFGPETKVKNYIHTKYQNSRSRFPQKRLRACLESS